MNVRYLPIILDYCAPPKMRQIYVLCINTSVDPVPPSSTPLVPNNIDDRLLAAFTHSCVVLNIVILCTPSHEMYMFSLPTCAIFQALH